LKGDPELDEFEHELSMALKSAPKPPGEIDIGSFTSTRSHESGRRKWLAPLATGMAVVAAASVTFIAVDLGRHHDRPVHAILPGASGALTSTVPSESALPTGDAGALLGGWQLQDLEGFDGAPHTLPSARLVLNFQPNAVVSAGCSTATIVVSSNSMTFTQDFVTAADLQACPVDLSMDEHNFLFRQILTGSVTWQISGTQLIIVHGTLAAVFTRVAN
jgi:hypothetical protein